MEGSFVPGGSHYLGLDVPRNTTPSWTFQYGEAAAGMLVGGMAYNNPGVLWAMDAVFASNASGTIEISQRHTDLANTETLPAYMMATQLFEGAMQNGTRGCWIRWTQNANVTSIRYDGGRLTIGVTGADGKLALGTPDGGSFVFSGISGAQVLQYPPPSWPWYLDLLALVLLIVLAVLLFIRARWWKTIRTGRIPTVASQAQPVDGSEHDSGEHLQSVSPVTSSLGSRRPWALNRNDAWRHRPGKTSSPRMSGDDDTTLL